MPVTFVLPKVMEAYFLALLTYHSTDFQEGAALQGSRVRSSIPWTSPTPPVPQFMSPCWSTDFRTPNSRSLILVSNVLGLWWSQLVLTTLVFISRTYAFTFRFFDLFFVGGGKWVQECNGQEPP